MNTKELFEAIKHLTTEIKYENGKIISLIDGMDIGVMKQGVIDGKEVLKPSLVNFEFKFYIEDNQFHRECSVDLSDLPDSWKLSLEKQLPVIISQLCDNCPTKNSPKCKTCSIFNLKIKDGKLFNEKTYEFKDPVEIGFVFTSFINNSTRNTQHVIFTFVQLLEEPPTNRVVN